MGDVVTLYLFQGAKGHLLRPLGLGPAMACVKDVESLFDLKRG